MFIIVTYDLMHPAAVKKQYKQHRLFNEHQFVMCIKLIISEQSRSSNLKGKQRRLITYKPNAAICHTSNKACHLLSNWADCLNKKTWCNAPRLNEFSFLLPDLDSNQDRQNQNLQYYRYTIGQFRWPTWIRTTTNSTKNCRTTVIL